jgi:tetratricopeptide (TPR) repeat protein
MCSYNLIVTRTLFAACLLGCFSAWAFHGQSQAPAAQQTEQPPPSKVQPAPGHSSDEENPPEEDESVASEKFVLNPLESERNIRVGNYYWHRGKYRAAAQRYERATKFNPSSAEAFFKLGEAEQKLKNKDAARVAFGRVVTLAPDSKLASEAKKKLGNKS